MRDLSARHRQTGALAARARGGGRKALASPATLDQLRAQVAAHHDHTIAEHHQNMVTAGFTLGAATVGRLLLGLRLTRKKRPSATTRRAANGWRACARLGRRRWPGWLPEDFVFIDESGVNRAMTRLYARSLQGTRAFGSAPRNWGENVSILGALALHATLEPMVISGATDGAVFLTYLKEVLAPQLWVGAVVVLDNLGAHKVKGVRELIAAAGARLLYLPPCSPDLNPIEMAWSKLKTHLRGVAARTAEALDAAIGQGWRAVSASDARGFFKRCGYSGLLN